MHWTHHISTLPFPCLASSQGSLVSGFSPVISGPGDSICPSEGSRNVEWACEGSPDCVPLSSCGVPEWGPGELLIRQTLVHVLSCPVPPFLISKEESAVTYREPLTFIFKAWILTQFSEISSVYGWSSLLEVLKASKNLPYWINKTS